MRRDRHPALRRETMLPPGSFDIHDHLKALRERDGQMVRWKRLPGKGRIAGVCAGLAYRFGMRPRRVRLAFVLGTLVLAGLPVVFYILAATFVRSRKRLPRDFDRRTA